MASEAQQWIETVTGHAFDSDKSFGENLKSGVILAELINVIKPGSVSKIYKGPMAMRQWENISLFLRGCQNLGMPKDDCFDVKDLTEGKNLDKVLGTLEGLGGLCQSHGVSVPLYGKIKYATANKRSWTPEQLKAQKEKDTGTMLSQGSSGIMERQAISKGGITFGNEYSGAGSNEATMVNSSSSGIMERQAVSKGGITFGNEYSGAGSTDATMVNGGSWGIMERQAVSKSGINFGNEYSGAGSSQESTLVNAGSSAFMARQDVSKGGITFGNNYSGAGSTKETSRLNQGSTGTMERVQVTKSGINFGNEYAGAGSTKENSIINQGSSSTMERAQVTKSGITFGNDYAGTGDASAGTAYEKTSAAEPS